MCHLTIFPTIEDTAGIISLAGALLVYMVVIFLLITAPKEEDKTSAKHKVYKVRTRYFWGLTICLIIILFVSLQFLPYARTGPKVDQVITVVGAQWVWRLAPGATRGNLKNFTGGNELSLPLNKNIEFIVTSSDVNHGFGIYNSQGVLLTQTQAMPGYENDLQYEFKEKGDYKILCMEYCGAAHAFMEATIHIY